MGYRKYGFSAKYISTSCSGTSLAISDSGLRVAVATADLGLHFFWRQGDWDTNWKLIPLQIKLPAIAQQLDISPDDQNLWAGLQTEDGMIFSIGYQEPCVKSLMSKIDAPILGGGFRNNKNQNEWIGYLKNKKGVHFSIDCKNLLNTFDNQFLNEFTKRNNRFTAAYFSPDGLTVELPLDDGRITLWNTRTPGTSTQPTALFTNTILIQSYTVSELFSPTKNQFLARGPLPETHLLSLWDATEQGIATKPPIASFDVTTSLNAAAFSPDGTQIVTCSTNNIQLWDISNPIMSIKDLRVPGVGLSRPEATFSPDGKKILVNHLGDHFYLFDITMPGSPLSPITTFSKNNGTHGAIKFSPTGDRLLSLSENGTAAIWDATKTGMVSTPITIFSGHLDTVTSAAFSSDGLKIVTSSLDGTAMLWDTTQKNPYSFIPLATFQAHTESVTDARFIGSAYWGAETDNVLTTSEDGTVMIWTDFKRGLISTPQIVLPSDDYKGGFDKLRAIVSPNYGTTLVQGLSKARLWNNHYFGYHEPIINATFFDWLQPSHL